MDKLYKLICIDDGDEFELNNPKISLGRDKNSNIVLRHGYPSRHHAEIFTHKGELVINDLNSTNGTYVNNRKIHRPTILHEGDVIQFDSIAYHVVPMGKKESTVLMENLKPLHALEEESSVVIIGGFSADDETAIREPYPLPPTWSLQDKDTLSNPVAIDRYSTEVIDTLVAQLPDKESLQAVVVVTSGKHESQLIGLSLSNNQQLWTVGRSKDCPIVLSDISISSRHACFFYNKGRWGISDENSKNGTSVNGRATEESLLNNNDRIKLGQVEFIFRLLPAKSIHQ